MNDVEMPFIDRQIDRCDPPGVDRIDIRTAGDADLDLGKVAIMHRIEQFFRSRGHFLGEGRRRQSQTHCAKDQGDPGTTSQTKKKTQHEFYNGSPNQQIFIFKDIIPNPLCP